MGGFSVFSKRKIAIKHGCYLIAQKSQMPKSEDSGKREPGGNVCL